MSGWRMEMSKLYTWQISAEMTEIWCFSTWSPEQLFRLLVFPLYLTLHRYIFPKNLRHRILWSRHFALCWFHFWYYWYHYCWPPYLLFCLSTTRPFSNPVICFNRLKGFTMWSKFEKYLKTTHQFRMKQCNSLIKISIFFCNKCYLDLGNFLSMFFKFDVLFWKWPKKLSTFKKFFHSNLSLANIITIASL